LRLVERRLPLAVLTYNTHAPQSEQSDHTENYAEHHHHAL
jgi:hypothetical protein